MTTRLTYEQYLQALYLLAERNTTNAGLVELTACYYKDQLERLDCMEPSDLMIELTNAGINLEDLT